MSECYMCGKPHDEHIPVGIGTREYRQACPDSASLDAKMAFYRVQLQAARKNLNQVARNEWAARQQSKSACEQYANAYERVTGEKYDPSILRTDLGPSGLGQLADE